MQRWVVGCFLALLLCAVSADDECPDGGQCEDGQTCCHHPSHGYECCPFEWAECCGDHVHCCPMGMTCDVDKSRCVNASLSVEWAKRTPTEQPKHPKSFRMIKSYVGNDDDNICPDQSRCPAEYSCLKTLAKYGCCPLAQGIPCSDGKHCCPQGHSCSEDSRSCVKKEVVSTVLCSDGVSECPEESSCCEGPDGQFGCCPMPQAVCCADKVHCCPEGSLCDLETSKCQSVSSKKLLPMWAKFPARRRAEWENQKDEQLVISEAAAGSKNEQGRANSLATKTVSSPGERASDVKCDDSFSCGDGQTCCPLENGDWGCCPLPKAVCCSDHASCCPEGTTCDVEHGECLDHTDSTTLPMSRKLPAISTAAPSQPSQMSSPGERASDVKCNDSFSCEDNQTCCPLENGDWGCCPLPKAVCCSDHASCCPEGTTCDVEHGECLDHTDSTTLPMSRKLPAISTAAPSQPSQMSSPGERASVVKCDDNFSCPDDQTCCLLTGGVWACCPYPKAVCCSDHASCCPNGTTCDVEHGECKNTSDSTTTPMRPKIPAIPTTALSTTAGMQNAGKDKSELTETEEDEENDSDEDVEHRVRCRGHKNSTCPRNATCCRRGCRKRRCCPMPKAKCCPDGKHCCPQGYKCRHKRCGCVKDGVEIPWYDKIPALSSPKQQPSAESQVTKTNQTEWTESKNDEDDDDDDEDDDDDDDEEDIEHRVHCKNSTCHRNATCCGRHCCRHSNAKCCHKGKHCCPPGFQCHPEKHSCLKDGLEIPWYATVPGLPNLNPVHVKTQVTETGQTERTEGKDDDEDDDDIEHKGHCNKTSPCPNHGTCCRRHCCPRNATCCRKHCCPHGFQCHPKNTTCLKDGVEIPGYSTVPALPSPKPLYAETQVTELGRTDPGESEEIEIEEVLEIVFGVGGDSEDDDDDDDDDDDEDDGDDEDYEDDEGEDEDASVRCDDHTTCPKGSSCCHCGGRWGCCPLPNAVCCSDSEHCCPHRYKCSEPRKACVRDNDMMIPWYPKLPALSNLETASDEYETCPNKQRCPKYTTCCLLSAKEYGCCPMENAVCCTDEKHCCPAGFGCDLPTKTCQRSVVLEAEFVALKPAKSKPLKEGDTQCGKYVCDENSKCCRNLGMFHCCPSDGICCNFGCCQSGQRCGKPGQCISKSTSYWDNWPFFAKRDEENPRIL